MNSAAVPASYVASSKRPNYLPRPEASRQEEEEEREVEVYD